eukprot:2401039-Rhodomonas_salina.1
MGCPLTLVRRWIHQFSSARAASDIATCLSHALWVPVGAGSSANALCRPKGCKLRLLDDDAN